MSVLANDLIRNKLYKIHLNDGNYFIFKFDKKQYINIYTIYHFNMYNDITYSELPTIVNGNTYKIFEEVNIEEIIMYLPLNHPDRILYRNERIGKLLKL